ncbi:MAG: (d)CMP kinase [Cellvibrionaceae bacterium]|nr:(d)CMP kinase [Cellvibrionaceae bacterium]
MTPVITVDGPSGAGKGTLCRLLAEKTGFHLLDSGAIYRLCALASLESGCDLEDQSAVGELARKLDIAFKLVNGATQILLAGEEVSTAIREERIGLLASKVAAYAPVRAALLERQRDFCRAPGLVADGRDMGTVVFPGAALKVFLTASAEERAKRRARQLELAGKAADYAKILQDIQQRDESDRNRENSPLVAASDALELDSTLLPIDKVFDRVYQKAVAQLGAHLGRVK